MYIHSNSGMQAIRPRDVKQIVSAIESEEKSHLGQHRMSVVLCTNLMSQGKMRLEMKDAYFYQIRNGLIFRR